MGSSQADAADQWEFKSFTFVGAPVNQVKVMELLRAQNITGW